MTWKIEGQMAYLEQSGPGRDINIRARGGKLIVNTLAATSEESVPTELEIPIDVVTAVLVAALAPGARRPWCWACEGTGWARPAARSSGDGDEVSNCTAEEQAALGRIFGSADSCSPDDLREPIIAEIRRWVAAERACCGGIAKKAARDISGEDA